MAESESKTLDFVKHAYIALRRDSRNQQDQLKLKPLILDFCNASLPRSFTDADTNYREQHDTFNFDVWYLYSFKRLLRVLAGDEIEGDEKRRFECLLDYFYSENHLACVQAFSSMVANGNISELKVATMMALHYFKPLMPDSAYIVDESNPSRNDSPVCEFCKQKVVYGDTSIGNGKVWHGNADIMLDSSIVKVNLEKDVEDIILKENSDDSDESDDDSSFIEEKTSSKYLWSKVNSQVISQTIVNAFYNVSKNKTLANQFVPSFWITEKSIRVILYNCELDILLISTKMPIWKKEGSSKLDLMTLVRVWLALNYSSTMDKRPEEYKFILQNTKTSRFKDLVTKDAYTIYQTDLHHPVRLVKQKPSDFESDSSDEEYVRDNDADTRGFKLKCLLELNAEVHKLKQKS